MAVIAPKGLVAGAPRLPLPYGLFSVVAPRPTAERWENGVIFETMTCEPVDGIGQQVCPSDAEPEASTVGLPKTLDQGAGPGGSASVFTVYGHFTCTPVGWTVDAAQERATLHLTTREEARVEQALWTGDLANVPNLSGANGFTAPTSYGTGLAYRDAVAVLEAKIASEYGSLAVLHMARDVATMLIAQDVLEVRGNRLQTVLGTPVIAGSGYTGDDIVATPQMFAYRSEVFTSSNRGGDLMDKAQNNLYAIAERNYVIGFEDCWIGTVSVEPIGTEPVV